MIENKPHEAIENDRAGKDYYSIINLPQSILESIIPYGCYCYDGSFLCPFWDYVENVLDQECGYCHLLEIGDIEINQKKIMVNQRTKTLSNGEELGIPIGLLWDRCKECDINMDGETLYDEE